MARTRLQGSSSAVWELARRQHGVVARRQLLELGFSRDAIAHRLAIRRLHRVRRGVYAVGRPELTQHGRWMAAVLSCGAEAVLSHESAAALWGIQRLRRRLIEVSVPAHVRRSSRGVVVHRRAALGAADVALFDGIPVTSPVRTLIDLAARLTPEPLEAAINEADKLDLVSPEALRVAAAGAGQRPGARRLRDVLDRRTFALTDSALERRFLRLARAAGLPAPETGRDLNGFTVDFYWPELGLVIETDGLRYHRTAAAQARDRVRDQAHPAAGLTPLRFTHSQVRFEPAYVQATLRAVARRLGQRHGGART